MKFHGKEMRDILISTVVLGFAFRNFSPFNLGLFGDFLVALCIVGVNFMAHELIGHKLFAQRLGAEAEYRMWPLGLLLAVVGSFVGFVFAAPGAVYFNPVVKGDFAFAVRRFDRKDIGVVSLAGPAVNMALGALFLGCSFFLLPELLGFAAYVSFFMAFFNLIPFPPLDGSKVLGWSRNIWLVSMAIAAAGFVAMNFL